MWAGAEPGRAPDATPATGSVSVIAALKFPFQGADWTNNLLIGSVFYLVPLVGPFALMGWHAEILQRHVRGHPQPVPKLDFSDLSHYLGRGAGPFVVTLVYMMPIMFVTYLMLAVAIGVAVGVAHAVREPVIAIPLCALIGILCYLLMPLPAVLLQGSMTRAELTEDVGASLSPGPVFAYAGKTFGKAYVSSLLFGFAILPLMLLGYAMCIIGLYPALSIISMASLHLRWQLYQHYLAAGGEPIPVKPPVELPSEQRARTWQPQGYG
jgi:hypothetical protein